MSEKKAGRPLGPAGEIVRANIARVRGRMPITELSTKLHAIGREIPPLGLRRIEDGSRRVDVDDLVAIAVALDVSPMTLLAPPSPDPKTEVEYTGLPEPIASEELLEWLMGKWPLPKTMTVLDFYARALPVWMKDSMLHISRNTLREFPPATEEERQFWGVDGDD